MIRQRRTTYGSILLAAPILFCSPADKLYFERARVESTRDTARSLGGAASVYCKRTGHWPASIGAMTPPECQGNLCLLGENPRDAFGKKAQPLRRGEIATSAGPDGKWFTDDDIHYTQAPLPEGCAIPGPVVVSDDLEHGIRYYPLPDGGLVEAKPVSDGAASL